MSGTTIVLADDHPIVRHGLRTVLAAAPGLEVVGEAADGLEAVEVVGRLQPDVLIVDVLMSGLSGLDVTRRVRQRSPLTIILVLSMHADEAYVLEALRNGAAGYVVKDASGADLVQAVRTVANGGRYLSPSISARAIDAYVERAKGAALDLYDTLTNREREVLHLAAEGYGNPELARRLAISTRTVETHRAHLMQKLQLQSQTELVHYAARRGIVPLTPHGTGGDPNAERREGAG